MYSDKLNRLIELSLVDGTISDNEWQVLVNQAQSDGIDVNELHMVVEGLLIERSNASNQAEQTAHDQLAQDNPKTIQHGNLKKCPSCGSPVTRGSLECGECGHEFQNTSFTKAYSDFINRLDKMRDLKLKRLAILDYPTPNTKEDIIDFLAISYTHATQKVRLRDERTIRDAWRGKLEQIFLKIKNQGITDPQLLKIIEKYKEDYKNYRIRAFLLHPISIYIIISIFAVIITAITFDDINAPGITAFCAVVIGVFAFGLGSIEPTIIQQDHDDLEKKK